MKRPLIITVWAAFLTLAAIIGIGSSIWAVASGEFRSFHLYEGFYAFYAPFSHVLGVILVTGIWSMRKWAFAGYVTNQIFGSILFWVLKPEWSSTMPYAAWGSLGAAAIFAATTFPYWRQMTWRPLPIRDASLDAPQHANS